MQATRQEGLGPPRVSFDSSLDGGIDQVLVLAMLFHMVATRRVRIGSISTGAFNLKKAAFLDAVARFYSGGQAGGYGPSRRMLPVGMATEGAESDAVPAMISAVLAKTNADGEPAYPHTVSGLIDTAVASAVTRNALMASEDQNAVVVLAGVPTNLLSLLDLSDGAIWAGRKVRVLSIAAGGFGGGDPDPVVQADIPGFRALLARWPTRVVMAGTDLNAISLPGSRLDGIAADEAEHPILDAYRAHGTPPYDLPTRALAAMLYATGPDEDYFELSEPGAIAILDDGRTEFTPSTNGTHHVLTVKPGQEERVLQAYETFLSAPTEDEG